MLDYNDLNSSLVTEMINSETHLEHIGQGTCHVDCQETSKCAQLHDDQRQKTSYNSTLAPLTLLRQFT